jgi:cob(I)alamin adenosyltransferase
VRRCRKRGPPGSRFRVLSLLGIRGTRYNPPMGNRLSKIYTRTGDKGVTGLGDGARVDKDSLRVEAYGTVDELNSAVGLVLAAELPEAVRNCLTRIQHELFDLGGELCMPGVTLIPDQYVDTLESDLDRFNDELPPLKDFILPGGSEAAARCHLARTVARRAERRVVSLAHSEAVNDATIRYLNRLSDLLFVVARVLARHEGGSEVLWVHGDRRG